MDEQSHAPLEDTLKALEPAEVSAELESKIFEIFEGKLTPTQLASLPDPAGDHGPDNVVPFPIWRRLGTAAAVLIAGVGVFFAALNSFGPAPKGAPLANKSVPTNPRGGGTFHPVSAENVFEGVSDGGMFLGEQGGPVRELRYQFSDSFRWENPEDGSVIEMTVPRQRSFLVPVHTD